MIRLGLMKPEDPQAWNSAECESSSAADVLDSSLSSGIDDSSGDFDFDPTNTTSMRPKKKYDKVICRLVSPHCMVLTTHNQHYTSCHAQSALYIMLLTTHNHHHTSPKMIFVTVVVVVRCCCCWWCFVGVVVLSCC